MTPQEQNPTQTSPSTTPTGLPFQNQDQSSEPQTTSPEPIPHQPPENPPTTQATPTDRASSRLLTVTLLLCAALAGATIGHLILKQKFPQTNDPTQLNQQRENISLLSQTNRERAAAGQPILSPSTQAETLNSITERISRDSQAISQVAKNLLETSQRKDTQIATKQRAYEDLDRQYQFVSRELTELKMKAQQNAIAATQLAATQTQLSQKNQQIDMLTKELIDAKTKLTETQPNSAILEVRRQLDEANQAKKFFEERCKQLETKLQTPAPTIPTQLFAKSEQDLEPIARQLYQNLRSFEGADPASLVKTYESLSTKYGATHIKTVSFTTSSSKIEAAQTADLQNLIASLPDRGMILVVGYASTTGDPNSNRNLSSARATAVANVLQQYKSPQQHVQAVYLGQTNRFGPEADRNQICEVWQIISPETK